jgi:hypothetical protein
MIAGAVAFSACWLAAALVQFAVLAFNLSRVLAVPPDAVVAPKLAAVLLVLLVVAIILAGGGFWGAWQVMLHHGISSATLISVRGLLIALGCVLVFVAVSAATWGPGHSFSFSFYASDLAPFTPFVGRAVLTSIVAVVAGAIFGAATWWAMAHRLRAPGIHT